MHNDSRRTHERQKTIKKNEKTKQCGRIKLRLLSAHQEFTAHVGICPVICLVSTV